MTDPLLTPRQVVEETQKCLLDHDIESYIDFFADDAVIEIKFTATGRPHKLEGKQSIAAALRASNNASPLRRKAFESTIIHETKDPATIIAEYDQISESKDGGIHSWSDVLVFTIRDGKIHSVRTYSNPIAIAKAMNSVDALINALAQ